MATTETQWKVYIFKKNSPWGVIKHPQKGNVYKHVVWAHGDKKNEFIDKELMPTGSKFADANFRKVSFTPINELSFNFTVSYKDYQQTYDQLNNSDFCAVKKPNDTRIYFYTLQVQKADVLQVEFLAELDVFFTYLDNNLLSDTRESFVVQGHENRYTIDRKIDWNKILKNQEPIVQINKLIKKHEIEYNTNTYDLKWLVLYVKNGWQNAFFNNYKQGTKTIKINDSFYSIGTNNGGFELPYTILLYPINIKGGDITYQLGINDEKIFEYDLLRMLLRENQYLISAHLKDWNELGINESFTITKQGAKAYKIKQNTLKNLEYLEISGKIINENKTVNVNDPIIYIYNLKDINEFDTTTPQKALTGKIYIDKKNQLDVEDPILFSPLYYKFVIKKWNKEGREYYFPRLIQKSTGGPSWVAKTYFEIKSLYSWSASNDQNIYWMEYDPNYKDNIIEGNFLTMEHQNTIDSQQDRLKEYMRDNANSFNTAYKQKIESGELQRARAIGGLVSAGTTMAGSIVGAAFNPLAGLGILAGANQMVNAGFNIAENEMRLKHTRQTRQATIDDLRNRLPSVITGNTTHLNNQIDRITDNENIKVLEYGLNDESKKMLLDHIKKYGYQVKTFENIKTFINTRKRYNYIECDDVFNDIVPNLSPRIKQTINDAFASGLYIWHYRSASQWKGIKNFTDNNDEV